MTRLIRWIWERTPWGRPRFAVCDHKHEHRLMFFDAEWDWPLQPARPPAGMIRKLRLFLIGCPVCGRWRTSHLSFCALRERY